MPEDSRSSSPPSKPKKKRSTLSAVLNRPIVGDNPDAVRANRAEKRASRTAAALAGVSADRGRPSTEPLFIEPGLIHLLPPNFAAAFDPNTGQLVATPLGVSPAQIKKAISAARAKAQTDGSFIARGARQPDRAVQRPDARADFADAFARGAARAQPINPNFTGPVPGAPPDPVGPPAPGPPPAPLGSYFPAEVYGPPVPPPSAQPTQQQAPAPPNPNRAFAGRPTPAPGDEDFVGPSPGPPGAKPSPRGGEQMGPPAPPAGPGKQPAWKTMRPVTQERLDQRRTPAPNPQGKPIQAKHGFADQEANSPGVTARSEEAAQRALAFRMGLEARRRTERQLVRSQAEIDAMTPEELQAFAGARIAAGLPPIHGYNQPRPSTAPFGRRHGI